MSRRTPYAYVCAACRHLSSHHGLVEGGDLRAGPYRCGHCPCEIEQDAPWFGLDRAQYEALPASARTNPRVGGEG